MAKRWRVAKIWAAFGVVAVLSVGCSGETIQQGVDQEPEPALVQQDPAFESAQAKVFEALTERGYDTSEGEMPSTNLETRVLIPAASPDSIDAYLSLAWGVDEPFGDIVSEGARVVVSVEVFSYRYSNTDGRGVWFACPNGLVVSLSPVDRSYDDVLALAVMLVPDGCGLEES